MPTGSAGRVGPILHVLAAADSFDNMSNKSDNVAFLGMFGDWGRYFPCKVLFSCHGNYFDSV